MFLDSMSLDKIPKHGKEYRERTRRYTEQGFKMLDEIIVPAHKEFRRFIETLITVDPRKRPSAREALKHKFVNMEIP